MRPEVTEIDEPVDRAQQVVRRHVSLEAELVEQCALNDLPLAHHRCASSLDDAIESPAQQHDKLGIFQQNRPKSDIATPRSADELVISDLLFQAGRASNRKRGTKRSVIFLSARGERSRAPQKFVARDYAGCP